MWSPFKLFSQEFEAEGRGQDGGICAQLLDVAAEREVVGLQELLRVVLPHLPAAGGEEEQLQVQEWRPNTGVGPRSEQKLVSVVQNIVYAEIAVEDGYEVSGSF